MFTGRFWRLSLERAVKSSAQVLLLLWGADGGLNVLAVDWRTAAGLAAGGAVLSVLMSLGSAGIGPKGSPSVVDGTGQ